MKNSRIWTLTFFGIFFANMAFNFGMMMINTMVTVYADSLGALPSQVGLLGSIYALTALLFRFVAGPSLASFNRKVILIGASVMMGIAFMGFSFSHTFGWLIFFRLVQGVGNAFGNVCCLAMASDCLPKERLNTGLGYYACAQIIAQAMGPPVGLKLVGEIGYPATYRVGAAVMLIAIILIIPVKLPARQYEKFSMNIKNSLAKEALIPAILTLLFTMSFMTVNNFLTVHAERKGIAEIGLYFTVYAIAVVASRPLTGKLADKWGFVRTGAVAAVFAAGALVIMGNAGSLWIYLAAAIPAALGFGVLQPSLQTLAVKTVPQERRGAASATYFIAFDLATLSGPWIAGKAADAVGYTAMWSIMTAPVALGLLGLILARKKITATEQNFISAPNAE